MEDSERNQEMDEDDSKKKERMNRLSDAASLLSQMKDQEKELKHKRMFLMGLTSQYGSDLKRHKSDLKIDESILPETILRDEDMFYAKVKKYVENQFGASQVADGLPVHTDHQELYQNSNTRKIIISMLDDLTTDGLYDLATTITECPISHEQTRPKMQNTIQENLVKVHQRRCPEEEQCQLCNHLSMFISNPNNFRRNHAMVMPPTVQSHFGAIMNVLDGLEDIPFPTLKAMYRRLKGHPGCLPSLDPYKSTGCKKGIVASIRMQSLCMLSDLDEKDYVPIPLIKAMAVASLSQKINSVEKPVTASFRDYHPDVEDLQGKLIQVINLLARKVKVPELDAVKDIMFQSSQSVSHAGCLRISAKRVFTELLFECSEFDAIPTSMLDAIAVLHTSSAMSSSKKVSKEVIEGEMESILRVSAQVKQILWDYLPDVEVEMDYADAYMEELEGSDNRESFDDLGNGEQLRNGDKSGFHVKEEQLDEDVASTGPMFPSPLLSKKPNNDIGHCTPSPCRYTGSTVKLEPDLEAHTDFIHLASTSSFGLKQLSGYTNSVIVGTSSAAKSSVTGTHVKVSYEEQNELSEPLQKSNSACHLTNNSSERRHSRGNQYLSLQDLSDETSLVSYQIIGHMLDDFAREDGLTLEMEDQVYLNGCSSTSADIQGGVSNGNDASSGKETAGTIIIKAVQKFLPSFPLRELEEAKTFLKL